MMPSASRPTSSGVGFWHWSSPVPYLFGGLALMLAVITVALVILACSYRRSLSTDESTDDPAEKTGAMQVEIMVDSDEPKIVVIMAGDENPSYLAKPKPKPVPPQPLPLVCTCQKIQQV